MKTAVVGRSVPATAAFFIRRYMQFLSHSRRPHCECERKSANQNYYKIDQKIFLKVIALFRLNEYNYISFQIQKQVRGVTNERIYNGSRSC